jgi:hypothetical protein
VRTGPPRHRLKLYETAKFHDGYKERYRRQWPPEPVQFWPKETLKPTVQISVKKRSIFCNSIPKLTVKNRKTKNILQNYNGEFIYLQAQSTAQVTRRLMIRPLKNNKLESTHKEAVMV